MPTATAGIKALSLLAVLLAFTGCTTTHDYAVIAARDEMAESDSCFRQCQQLRAAGTNKYLGCLKTCDGVRVVREKKCAAVEFDPEEYGCTTERNQSFSLLPLLGLLAVIALGLTVAAVAAGAGR